MSLPATGLVASGLFEGQAPYESGLLAVERVFYRYHEITCPGCGQICESRALTDVKAAFGLKGRCCGCGQDWIYRWDKQESPHPMPQAMRVGE